MRQLSGPYASTTSTTPSLPSLQNLAVRATEGSEVAFEELHRRLRRGVSRYFAGGGHPSDCEDLVQQVWVEFWLALREKRYDSVRSTVTTFVYALARRVRSQQRRSVARRRPSYGLTDKEMNAPGAVWEHDACDSMQDAELHRELHLLFQDKPVRTRATRLDRAILRGSVGASDGNCPWSLKERATPARAFLLREAQAGFGAQGLSFRREGLINGHP